MLGRFRFLNQLLSSFFSPLSPVSAEWFDACSVAGDRHRILSHEQLLDLSLPYAEISYEGEVCLAKADGSAGVLDCSTCAQQLLYEIGDPGAYITPDVVSSSCI